MVTDRIKSFLFSFLLVTFLGIFLIVFSRSTFPLLSIETVVLRVTDRLPNANLSFCSASVLNLSIVCYSWPPWNLLLFVPRILGTSYLITAACLTGFLLHLPKMKSALVQSLALLSSLSSVSVEIVYCYWLSTVYCHQLYSQCGWFTTLPNPHLSYWTRMPPFQISSRR